MSKFEANGCPLCGNPWGYPLYPRVREFPDGEVKVRDCIGCDIAFLNPVMTDEAYKEFYDQDQQRNFLAPFVDENYRDKINAQTKRRIDLIRECVPDTYEKPLRLLDVGTGCSNFVSEALRNLPIIKNSRGLEPSILRAEESRRMGQDTICGDIFCNEVSKYRPSLVTLFQVLEHIKRPKEFLNRVNDVMSKNGLLIIEVPNHDDFLVRCVAYKSFYYQNAHCYYYTPQSLKTLVERCGFRVVKEQKVQRYSFDNHLHWRLRGKPGKVWCKWFNSLYSWALKSLRLHDTIFFICEKLN